MPPMFRRLLVIAASVFHAGGRACHEIEDHVVCFDPSLGLDHENCLVYSFGIQSHSFETAMVNFGCQVSESWP